MPACHQSKYQHHVFAVVYMPINLFLVSVEVSNEGIKIKGEKETEANLIKSKIYICRYTYVYDR